MFFVYLFAAVAGCLLVLVSLFSGGHQNDGGDGGDAVGDNSTTDAVHDGEGTAHGPAGQAGHAGHGHDAATGLLNTLGWLLSLQLWTYLLAFGGLTGLLLRTVAHLHEPLAAVGALTVGLGTALGARSLLRKVVGSSDSGTTSHDRLVGSSATVLIPAGPGATGKIRLSSRGHLVDLLARASDGGSLVEGAAVSILEVRDGVAEVTRDDDDRGAGVGADGAHVKRAVPHPLAPDSIKSKG